MCLMRFHELPHLLSVLQLMAKLTFQIFAKTKYITRQIIQVLDGSFLYVLLRFC